MCWNKSIVELVDNKLTIKHPVNAYVIFYLQFTRSRFILIKWKLALFVQVVSGALKYLNLAICQKVCLVFFTAIILNILAKDMLLYFLCTVVGCNADLDKFMIPYLVEIERVWIRNPVLNKVGLLRKVYQGERHTPVNNWQIVIVDNVNFLVYLLEYLVPFRLHIDLFSWNFLHKIKHFDTGGSPDIDVLLFLWEDFYNWRLKGKTSLFELQFTVVSAWIKFVINHSHYVNPTLVFSQSCVSSFDCRLFYCVIIWCCQESFAVTVDYYRSYWSAVRL